MVNAAIPPSASTVRAPAAMQALARRWHRAECGVAMAAFTLIAALLIIDVVGRELWAPLARASGLTTGATGVPGGLKIAVYAMVLGAFCGIGIASATNVHLVPRVGAAWVPRPWAPWMARLGDAFTAAFMMAAAWYALQFVMASKATSMRAAVLGWEVWPFQLAIPLGFVSAALRHAMFSAWPGLKPPPPEFQE